MIVATIEDVGRPRYTFAGAQGIAQRILAMFDAGEFDVCTVVYNKFVSALTQPVTPQQLVPFAIPEGDEDDVEGATTESGAAYEYEPSEEEILGELVPRNLAVQLFRAMLESFASEQGSRMTAMDNATRNAGDLINDLTISYNRTRQAAITKELIEIISGAEAL
jgi:F-type H+-transporting ATPase subunit gamma